MFFKLLLGFMLSWKLSILVRFFRVPSVPRSPNYGFGLPLGCSPKEAGLTEADAFCLD